MFVGRITAQLPDGPTLCMTQQRQDIFVVSSANLIIVNSDLLLTSPLTTQAKD